MSESEDGRIMSDEPFLGGDTTPEHIGEGTGDGGFVDTEDTSDDETVQDTGSVDVSVSEDDIVNPLEITQEEYDKTLADAEAYAQNLADRKKELTKVFDTSQEEYDKILADAEVYAQGLPDRKKELTEAFDTSQKIEMTDAQWDQYKRDIVAGAVDSMADSKITQLNGELTQLLAKKRELQGKFFWFLPKAQRALAELDAEITMRQERVRKLRASQTE